MFLRKGLLFVSALLLTVAAVAAQDLPSITARPDELEFKAAPGSAAITRQVSIGSSSDKTPLGSFTATAKSDGWLSVSPASGTGAAALQITATPGKLVAGEYHGTVTVSATGFRSVSINVELELGIGDDDKDKGDRGGPSVGARPDSLFFRVALNGPAQTAEVALSGRGNTAVGAFTAKAAVNTPTGGTWLSVTPTSGTGNTTLKVTATPGSLAAGQYSGTITITSTVFPTMVLKVTLQVGAVTGDDGKATNALMVRPDELKFKAVAGGPAVAAQAVAVFNPAGDNFDWTAAAAVTSPAAGKWLKLSPASGHGKGSLSVSVDPTGLAAGDYSGTITVTSGTQAAKVSVKLSVEGVRPAKLGITPKAFHFVAGGDTTKLLTVLNTGSGTLTWTAVAAVNTPAGGKWLTISPTSGSTTTTASSAGNITLKVDTTGLAPGEYSAKVTVTAGTDKEEAQVFLRVSKPVVLVAPRELKFTATAGTPSPATRDVTVTSTASGLTFTASTATAWLTVTPASGAITSASKVTVSVKASAITAFTHGVVHGQVEVKTPGAAKESNVIRVALKIFGAGDTPRLELEPGGLGFTAKQGAANPDPKTAMVEAEGAPAGGIAFTTSVTTAKGGSWLSVTPATGTSTAPTPAKLTVSANITGLLADTYTGTVVLTPAAASGAPAAHLTVTLVVAKPGTDANGSFTASFTTMALNGTASVATGPLTAFFTSPSDNFITQVDLPLNISVTVLDSAGQPVQGAEVVIKSSNSEPDLILTDAGNGVYSGVFRALGSGPLSLAGSAKLDTGSVLQTSSEILLSGDMEASQTDPTVIYQDGAVSAASYATSPTPLAPGSLMSLFGIGIAGNGGFASGRGSLPTTLGGVTVTIGGVIAPLVSATAGANTDQINLQVPFEMDGVTQGDVVVNNNGVISSPETVAIGLAPAIFTIGQSGSGAGAILHGGDYSLVNDARPAAAGEAVLIYCTGLGPLKTLVASGELVAGANDVRAVVNVFIGGQPAAWQYAGAAPGFAGLYQINVTVPGGLAAGDQALAVTVGGTPATGRATIKVR